jgi:hypothetical protein
LLVVLGFITGLLLSIIFVNEANDRKKKYGGDRYNIAPL